MFQMVYYIFRLSDNRHITIGLTYYHSSGIVFLNIRISNHPHPTVHLFYIMSLFRNIINIRPILLEVCNCSRGDTFSFYAK